MVPEEKIYKFPHEKFKVSLIKPCGLSCCVQMVIHWVVLPGYPSEQLSPG